MGKPPARAWASGGQTLAQGAAPLEIAPACDKLFGEGEPSGPEPPAGRGAPSSSGEQPVQGEPPVQGKPLPPESRPPLVWGSALYFIAVITLVALSLFSPNLSAALLGLFPGMDEQALTLAVEALYYLPCLLLPSALLLRRKNGWEAARLKPIGTKAMLAVVGLALAGLFFVQYFSVLWMMLLEALHVPYLDVELAMPTTSAGLTMMVLSMGVLPGVCEEFLFRGALLGTFERWGTRRAIWITALLFALLHGSPAGLPAQLFLGLLLGYVAFAFDSIYAAIAYHTVHNAAIVLINAYSAAEPVTQEEAALLEQGTFAYMGGWQGVMWIVIYTALLGWALWGFLRVVKRYRLARGIAAAPPRSERMRAGGWALLAASLLVVAGLYALNFAAAARLG